MNKKKRRPTTKYLKDSDNYDFDLEIDTYWNDLALNDWLPLGSEALKLWNAIFYSEKIRKGSQGEKYLEALGFAGFDAAVRVIAEMQNKPYAELIDEVMSHCYKPNLPSSE